MSPHRTQPTTDTRPSGGLTTVRRLVAVGTSLVVLTGTVLASAGTAAATPGQASRTRDDGPAVQRFKPTPGKPVRRAPRPKPEEGIDPSIKPINWPAARQVTVSLPDQPAAGTGDLVRADGLPVWVGEITAQKGTTDEAAGSPAGETRGRSVRVRSLPRDTSQALGLTGPAFQITDLRATAPDASGERSLRIRIDTSGFAGAYGGDWASRLRLVQLPACAATTPKKPACRTASPIGRESVTRGRHTATVQIPIDTPATADGAATAAGGPGVPATAPVRLADSGTGGTTLTFTTTASGKSGDWTQSKLGPTSTWQAGGSTGSFTWSYPLRTPPVAGGLTPDLALSYDSSSVDGRVSSSNNQPSWVGEGFSLSPGFIERAYVPCRKDPDGEGNLADAPDVNYYDTTAVGDLCWSGDHLTLSLDGAGGELVPYTPKDKDEAEVEGAGTQPTGEWRLRPDDGSRLARFGAKGTAGEYYRLTTTDGTRYYFGKGRATPGAGDTQSAWKMPVFSNQSDEPCYQADFAGSHCRTTWRWNLDYVVDRHGNTITYYWIPETNNYGRNRNSGVATYDRGGYLSRIDYGTTQGSEDTATAPARVKFSVEERCDETEPEEDPANPYLVHDPLSCESGELTDETAHHWPDVPFDQICDSQTSCDTTYAPTFFTRKRLTAVTTQVAGDEKDWKQVDQWTFTHSYPDPNDGATSPTLFLTGIQQANGGTVVLGKKELANRVDGTNDNADKINKYRVNKITDEYNQIIDVAYTSPGLTPALYTGCTIAEVGPDADPAPDPATNTRACFPMKYTEPGKVDPDAHPHWFYKHLVANITQSDGTAKEQSGSAPATSEDLLTSYEYLGDPAWAKDVNAAIFDDDLRTWNQWRGYSEVAVTVGEGADQEYTKTLYYRGMHGDDDGNDGTRTVNVTDSDGTSTVDRWWLAGLPREVEVFDGPQETTRFSSTITSYGNETAGAKIRMPLVTHTTTTTVATNGGTHAVDRDYTHDPDGYGLVTEVDDHAVARDADGKVTSDDQLCTSTDYALNPGIWMLDKVGAEKTVSVGCLATATQDDMVSGTRYYYDGNTDPEAAATQGELDRVEQLEKYTNGVAVYTPTTKNVEYDDYGRTTKVTDGLDRTTTTVYTDSVPGAVASTVDVTTPDPDGAGGEGLTTATDYSTQWGLPTRVEQPNGHVTTAKYDGLGRLEEVWKPGNNGTYPDVAYDYQIANGAAETADWNTITTTTLTPDGEQHIASVQIIDGLLRPRQTQTSTGDYASDGTGSRVVSDTIYDSHGNVAKRQGRIYQPQEPDTTLTMPTTTPPLVTTYTYDGLGRETKREEVRQGEDEDDPDGATVHAITETSYDGSNVTTVEPPEGGTTTTTVTDPRGRTVELQEKAKTGSSPLATTRYTYTPAGQLKTIRDSAGTDENSRNTWSYGYDLLGRRITADDPDAGTTTRSYDIMGQPETTDHEGQVLAYTYDGLGRRTGVYDDTPDPANIRASWQYDSVSPGLPTGSTRYIDGQPAYTVAVTGYDAGNRPTGTTTTVAEVGDIPAKLAGDYSTHATYLVTGAPATTEYSAQGPLAAEVIEHDYDQIGRPVSMVGSLGAYVLAAKWSVLGQLNQLALGNTYGTLSWHSFGYKEATGRLAWSKVDRQQRSTFDEKTTYDYDPVGNVTRITTGSETDPFDNQCFSYDALRQLTQAWTPATDTWTSETDPAGTATAACAQTASTAALAQGPATYWTSWVYDDATGNRRTETRHLGAVDETSTYSYPAAGSPRPHAVTAVDTTTDPPVHEDFTYDARGNTRTRDGKTWTWDAEGHLDTVTDPALPPETQVVQSALYDADGRRVLRQNGNVTTLYLPDGTELTATKDPDTQQWSVTGRRYYTFAGRTIAVREGNNRSDVTTLLDDHQGTATYAINNTTGDLQTRRQTPFGDTRGDIPQAWPGQRGFVGGTQDDDLGMLQVGARPYDPALGIFLAPDPILDPGDSRQINGYAYANNNPTTFSDPTGLKLFAGVVDGNGGTAGADPYYSSVYDHHKDTTFDKAAKGGLRATLAFTGAILGGAVLAADVATSAPGVPDSFRPSGASARNHARWEGLKHTVAHPKQTAQQAASGCIAHKAVCAGSLAAVAVPGAGWGSRASRLGRLEGAGVAAKSVPEGVVYRRTDLLGGKPYIGQAKSEARYGARQSEHARANPDADFEFEIIGRANPGTELDRMEEFFIRQGGGPTNLGNPNGGLANLRHQMSDPRYWGAGGDLW